MKKIKAIHILHGGSVIYNSQVNKTLWEQTISKKSTQFKL